MSLAVMGSFARSLAMSSADAARPWFFASSCSSWLIMRRTGFMATSLHSRRMSEPLNPSVHFATCARSTSTLTGCGALDMASADRPSTTPAPPPRIEAAGEEGGGTPAAAEAPDSVGGGRGPSELLLLLLAPRSSFSSMTCLAVSSGSVTKTRFSRRRSRAMSSSQGMLDAASTNTSASLLAKPSIWIRSSVFMRRLPSCSLPPSNPPRCPMMASISSRKMVEGAWYLASSNSTRTNFSESPRYLLTMLDAEMLKNVVLHSVATAFASMVFPVPGGPYSKMPCQGLRRPVNSCGYLTGMTTASFSRRFADPKLTTSSQVTPGFDWKMSRVMACAKLRRSGSPAKGKGFNSRSSMDSGLLATPLGSRRSPTVIALTLKPKSASPPPTPLSSPQPLLLLLLLLLRPSIEELVCTSVPSLACMPRSCWLDTPALAAAAMYFSVWATERPSAFGAAARPWDAPGRGRRLLPAFSFAITSASIFLISLGFLPILNS
mmetsp:Transcript_58469/g.117394  ORF Transcript_58469/g.117394 Transcript_58469/m.117394 type:complete len:491 (-) Transcript_58469:407-1879(-)